MPQKGERRKTEFPFLFLKDLRVYLFERQSYKEVEWERQRQIFHSLSPPQAAMARLSQAEPRPGIPPGSPMRVTGTQALGPSIVHCFPWCTQESWAGSGATGTQTSAHKRCQPWQKAA